MPGYKCPICEERTYHDNENHFSCSHCKSIGWPTHKAVVGVGKGRGLRCPNCMKLTLHDIAVVEKITIRRCKVCNYTLIHLVNQSL